MIQYVTVSGDLDQIEEWKIQGYIVLPTWEGSSEVGAFMLHENITDPP